MLEWMMVPALIGVAALVPKTSSDKKKIQTIFETVGFGVPSKDRKKLITPKFKKKTPILDGGVEIGTRYFYTIPLGLQGSKMGAEEKRSSFFTDGLGRPVIIEFKPERKGLTQKFLQISVYHHEIPEVFPYNRVPKEAGGKWVIPLGRGLEGVVWHNFDHIPHMTVAGMTRFGKTVFLKVLVTYLIETHGEDVEFYLIDLKGGLEFGPYEELRQVKAVASNPMEALTVLQYLHSQLEEEYVHYRKHRMNNITKSGIKKRRFVIVDEAAQLAPEKWMKDAEKKVLGQCQWVLSELTRIGGGLGYREVFCTQYPTSDTLPRSIKQNSDGKISFRLPSGYASEVAIDEYGAEKLPSDVRGRALYKTHELKELQVPLLEDEEMWEILKGEVQHETSLDEFGEKETTAGTNLVDGGNVSVQHKGTNPTNAQPGNRSKRPKGAKRTKTVPPRSESRREERLLPKRKGKGMGRNREGGQMDPPSGTSLT